MPAIPFDLGARCVAKFRAVRLWYIHDARVVLLHATDAHSGDELRQALLRVASGESPAVQVDELSLVEAIDGTSFLATASARDAGVDVVRGSLRCALTPDGWVSVAGLLEPFADATDADFFDRHSHQYLS